MSLAKLVATGALALTLSAVAPSTASADFLFTPFIGGNWGGSAKITDIDGTFEQKFEGAVDVGDLGASAPVPADERREQEVGRRKLTARPPTASTRARGSATQFAK